MDFIAAAHSHTALRADENNNKKESRDEETK